MTSEQLDRLEQMHSVMDLDAFKFMHQNFDDLLSLARIGLAAVEAVDKDAMADSAFDFDAAEAAEAKMFGLAHAYLARKDVADTVHEKLTPIFDALEQKGGG